MKKKILFVCVENSCRSQMAEAFAKMHGSEKVDAYSSGSKPSGIVNPKAIASMQQIGYDLATHNSKGLDDIPQEGYEYAITMGCGDSCPNIKAKHKQDWNIPDPKNMDVKEFADVRGIIEQEVLNLLTQINE